MNLKVKEQHRKMAGKTQWVDGYQLQIGTDLIVRNVPAEVVDILLANSDVWERHEGPVSAHQRGLPASVATTKVAQVQTIEVPLVPQSLQYLESLPTGVLALLSQTFGITPTEVSSKGALARDILKVADAQLREQLLTMVSDIIAKNEPATPEAPAAAPEAPAAAEEPGAAPEATKPKKGKGAVSAPAEPAKVSTIED